MSSRSRSSGLGPSLALLAAAVACSGATHAAEPAATPDPAAPAKAAPASVAVAAPGAVQGTLLGEPFEVRSAVSGRVWGTGGGVAVVVLSDQPETCDLRAAKKQKRSARRIHLVLSYKSDGATSPPQHKGSFVVGDYGEVDYADAHVVWNDAKCANVRRVAVKRGEVQLLRYPRPQRPQEYGGTFTLTVGDDRITGSFTAPLCDAVSRGAGQPPDATEPECE